MPIESKAQQRFMFAHQGDSSRLGSVAREFIQKTPKGAYKKLPARVKEPKTPKPSSFGSLDGS
jgi:hypothetical protein